MAPVLHRQRGPAGTRILGVGSYQPDRVITNDDLAKVLNTDDEWIRSRVGVRERRFARADETPVDMAVRAGTHALLNAEVEASEVDTVIVPNCTMLAQIPNAAAQVAHRLGAAAPAAFDLNTGCAGFCYGLGVASSLILAGTANRVLVIAAEKLTNVINPLDRNNAVIFADGAGAAVVGASDDAQIGPVAWGSAGHMADAMRMPDAKYVHQDGKRIFQWASRQMAPTALRALELAGLRPQDVDVLIPHQANLRLIRQVERNLRTAGAREDMVVSDDITHSGNTSAASIPIALDHMRQAGTAKPGDVVLMVALGAGVTYAGQVVICP